MKGIDFWNDRYDKAGYVYGEQPNEFLKEHLPQYSAGTILFPAEGEGRNAVFAAKLGWKVSAFDWSREGQRKALRLAEMNGVAIDYKLGEFQELQYNREQFDAIALIFAHFSSDKKSEYHKSLSNYLRRGGIIIFEAFAKEPDQPNDDGKFFSINEIKSDFADFDVIELTEKKVELNEGIYHIGKRLVIRFVGRKK